MQQAPLTATWQSDQLGTVKRVDHAYAWTTRTWTGYDWTARSYEPCTHIYTGEAQSLIDAQRQADRAIKRLLAQGGN